MEFTSSHLLRPLSVLGRHGAPKTLPPPLSSLRRSHRLRRQLSTSFAGGTHDLFQRALKIHAAGDLPDAALIGTVLLHGPTRFQSTGCPGSIGKRFSLVFPEVVLQCMDAVVGKWTHQKISKQLRLNLIEYIIYIDFNQVVGRVGSQEAEKRHSANWSLQLRSSRLLKQKPGDRWPGLLVEGNVRFRMAHCVQNPSVLFTKAEGSSKQEWVTAWVHPVQHGLRFGCRPFSKKEMLLDWDTPYYSLLVRADPSHFKHARCFQAPSSWGVILAPRGQSVSSFVSSFVSKTGKCFQPGSPGPSEEGRTLPLKHQAPFVASCS